MFRKLLVPLDRSALAEQALGPAAAIARASHAELDIVLVHQPAPFAGFEEPPWTAQDVAEEDEYLESTAVELASGAGVPTTHAVLHGDASEMISMRALDVNADLVVMTSHGRTGLSRIWLGSVADGVLRRSTIPVLVLRPTLSKHSLDATRHLFKHVLVPFNGSDFAAESIASAASLARCAGGRVSLLRVVEPIPVMVTGPDLALGYGVPVVDAEATDRAVARATQEITEAASKFAQLDNVTIEPHVLVSEHIAQTILDFARGHSVDALAMSTHARRASRLILGSVADKIVRGSELPVLLYRPPHVNPRSRGAGTHGIRAQVVSS